MAKIGELQQVQRNMENEYDGYISTLNLSLKLRLRNNKDFNSSYSSPDYTVLAIQNGQEITVGGAWLRTPNSPDSEVKEFLAIQIDDPSMPAPMNLSAFPKSGGKWDITFRRRRTQGGEI